MTFHAYGFTFNGTSTTATSGTYVHQAPPMLAVDLDIPPHARAADIVRAAAAADRILWPNWDGKAVPAIAPLFAAIAREAKARGATAYVRLVRAHDRQRLESRVPTPPPSEITVTADAITTDIDWPSRGSG